MATSDPGPLLSVLAGEDPIRAGAAPGPADHRPADQQVGGTLEGMYQTCWEVISPSGLVVDNNAGLL